MAGGGIGEFLIASAAAMAAHEGLRAAGAPPIVRIPAAMAASFFAPQAAAAAFPSAFGAAGSAGAGAAGSASGAVPGAELPAASFGPQTLLRMGDGSGFGAFLGGKSGGENLFRGLLIGSTAKQLLSPERPSLSGAGGGLASVPGRSGNFRPTSDPQLQALVQLMAQRQQRRFFG